MRKICLKDKVFELSIPEKEIDKGIAEMATKIENDLADKNPLFVCVLNGAFMFTANLMQQLDGGYEMAFARYSSYAGVETTGKINEVMPLNKDVKGRVVVLLEDIIDTGYTMSFVKEKIMNEGASQVLLATMLFKPTSLRCNLKPDYVGLEIPDEFIVGYGLDYDDLGRGLKDIYTIFE